MADTTQTETFDSMLIYQMENRKHYEKELTGKELKAMFPKSKFYIFEYFSDYDSKYFGKALEEEEAEISKRFDEIWAEKSAKTEPLREKIQELHAKTRAQQEEFFMTREEAEACLKEHEQMKAEDDRIIILAPDNVEDMMKYPSLRLKSTVTEEEKIQLEKDMEELNRLSKEECDIFNSYNSNSKNYNGCFETVVFDNHLKDTNQRAIKIGLREHRKEAKEKALSRFTSGGGQSFFDQSLIYACLYSNKECSGKITQIDIPDEGQNQIRTSRIQM